MSTSTRLICFLSALMLPALAVFAQADPWHDAERGFADNEGVQIHYAVMGEGPLVVMIHGFPDFWYSWRHQMAQLQEDFKVVAIDQRGYNRSGQPDGDEHYEMRHLVSDIAAVIRHFGRERAVIAGHDWGGSVAWQFAFHHPEMVHRLIVLNLPHPNGMRRELTINPEQRASSAYAQRFREGSPEDPDILFGGPMTAETLSAWVSDPAARERYREAFERSDFAAMLAYYKRNYPPLPEASATPPEPLPGVPRLGMPVLVFHGLDDAALHSDGLNNTWDWIDADTTIVAVPGAGHFVQHDAAELVSETMQWWLRARQ